MSFCAKWLKIEGRRSETRQEFRQVGSHSNAAETLGEFRYDGLPKLLASFATVLFGLVRVTPCDTVIVAASFSAVAKNR
jgi:hypothetical protein